MGKGLRVSKGTAVPKCGLGLLDHEPGRFPVGAEWEVKQEGEAGAVWARSWNARTRKMNFVHR